MTKSHKFVKELQRKIVNVKIELKTQVDCVIDTKKNKIMTKEEKTEKFIHVGMVSSYLQLIEGKGYGEIIEIQNKHAVKNVFFLSPVDVDTGDLQKSDVESMIDHFIEREEYEKCDKLQRLINSSKCDEDGWLFLGNRL